MNQKLMFFMLFSVFMISLVIGAQGTQNVDSSNIVSTSLNLSNQGDETQLQNRVQIKLQEGNYENTEGKQIQVQKRSDNLLELSSDGLKAKTGLNIETSTEEGKTLFNAKLSNGKNMEVKIMPDTASERALERLRLNVCSEENNCSIELKEVGNGNQTKAAYEVKVEKQARVLGLFKTKMQVQAQVDAENGEVIQTKKPWWAFLASESEE